MKKNTNLQLISDAEIIRGFYLSQGLLLVISVILYLVFHSSVPLSQLFKGGNISHIFLFGAGGGVIIALLEMVLDRVLPRGWFDDGGINDRVFQALSVGHIFIAMFIVAVIEELLFRGILQSVFGLIIASLIFGFVHIRYLKKPLMLIMTVGIGYIMGWLFQWTGSLWVPIACHYVIDTLLGLLLKQNQDT